MSFEQNYGTFFKPIEAELNEDELEVPTNLADLSDEEISEYEEYCRRNEKPDSDDELCNMQQELGL
jgi:hypothetical protein